MKNLSIKYEASKTKAKDFMKKGQISQYMEALLEMNKYERLMTAIVAN